MKKFYFIFFVVFLGNFNTMNAQATFTSKANGNWTSSGTWAKTGSGGTNLFPGASDFVIIGNHTVTVNANSACSTFTTRPTASSTTVPRINVSSAYKLTVSNTITVEPNNNFDNITTIAGTGTIETNYIAIGSSAFSPTVTKRSELIVLTLANFIVNNDINIETPVLTDGGSRANQAKLRHQSGKITLKGQLKAAINGTGYSGLGYRSETTANPSIVFEHADPIVVTTVYSGQLLPDFTFAGVEYKSIATTAYALLGTKYKTLILNSNRTFTPSVIDISIGSSFQLAQGLFSGIVVDGNDKSVILDNNATISITNGSFKNDENSSRPKFFSTTSLYNVTYGQSTASPRQSGLELTPVFQSSNNKLSTLTISNSNGVSVNSDIQPSNLIINSTTTISGSGKIKVSDLMDVPAAVTATLTNGQVTLASSALKTARVANLSLNPTIIGKVNVERYFDNNRRQWRLLTAPVKGSVNNSIYYNWQNNGVSGVRSNTGIDFWGPDGSMAVSAGVVTNSGNGLMLINFSSYNMRKFNNADGTWSNVTNTLTDKLFEASINKGFLVFAPYPFLGGTIVNGGFNNGNGALTVTALGELITGNITYSNILTNKFYLIGNPYASAIDFATMLADANNSGVEKIWLMDPTIGAYGGYVTWDAIAGYSVQTPDGETAPVPSFSGSTLVQSGQAFFVKANTVTTSLTIKESHKSTAASSNTTFNKSTVTKSSTSASLFRVLLEKELSVGDYKVIDGCVAAFYEGGSNLIDNNDGNKLGNPSENISLSDTNSSLSIEHRALVQDNDYLTLRVTNVVSGNKYKLKLYTENFTFAGHAFLEDSFSNKITEIPLNGTAFQYDFDVTSDSKSTGNRFKITFKQQGSLGIPDVFKANFNIYPNPASNDTTIKLVFSDGVSADNFSYKIYSILGQVVYNGDVDSTTGIGFIKLNGRLPSGVYFVQLQNTISNEQFTKKLIIK